jgi:hypothetical protein
MRRVLSQHCGARDFARRQASHCKSATLQRAERLIALRLSHAIADSRPTAGGACRPRQLQMFTCEVGWSSHFQPTMIGLVALH